MTRQDDGGPAFPVPTISGPDLTVSYPEHVRGMTLRDWFAGQAMAGVVQTCNLDTINDSTTVEQHFAGKAYAIADAMLAAREAR